VVSSIKIHNDGETNKQTNLKLDQPILDTIHSFDSIEGTMDMLHMKKKANYSTQGNVLMYTI
jgi:hypothetical protein